VSRVRSWLAAPLGARLLGVALVAAGVALLVLGLIAFNDGDGNGGVPGAAPGPSGPAASSVPGAPTVGGSPSTGPSVPSAPGTIAPSPTTTPPATTATTTPAPTRAPAPVRTALTVLNNSTVSGLGDRAAADARAKGWTVAAIGNFAGRIPVSTVYFTAGNAAEERAARQLAADLPQVDRVYPRYEGLPPTPTGVVLVVTRDW
jgi:hypothetical protein